MALLIVYLVIMGLAALLWCGIASRLGYPGALGLLMFIPIAGLIMVIYFACAESPNEAKLRRLSGRGRGSYEYDDERRPYQYR
jgi:hypothetical protein